MKNLQVFLIISVLLFAYVEVSTGQTIARDDFYVIDRPQFIETQLNDENPIGYFGVVVQAAHGTAQNGNGMGCNICAYFTPLGNYTGSDYVAYLYAHAELSNTASIYLVLIGNNQDAQNAGESCPIYVVGEPVNVTNGNMWIKHNDFILPGIGDFIEIKRFYNSIIQTTGLFGFGWSTKYDESLQFYDDRMIQLNQPDGRAVYFSRANTNVPFFSFSPGVAAEIAQNQDGSYTLTYKDGSLRNFGANGKLMHSKDRNGNQTTLTYNPSGHLTAITDHAGRTITLTSNTDGTIAQVNDSIGLVASYEYFPNTPLLKTVTFADGSKYKFEYTTVGSKTLLTTVKDALDNILEYHEYDSQGRATTSEKQGGVEKYTLDYSGWDATYGQFTSVTDSLGRITKYFHTRKYATNLVTRTEGVCSGCGSGSSEVTTYEYDLSNSWLNLKKKTDALGRQTHYAYDNDRNLIQQVDPLGTQKWTYNALGQVLTYQDQVDSQTSNPTVNTQENTYDSNGNLLTTKDALNNTTTLTYTTNGQLATVKDARNNTTTLTYDTQGRLTQVKDANNENTNFAYDARARVTSVTNALSQATSFEYDLNNRLKKIIYPDTNFVENTYDLAGRRTTVKDARGNTTTFGYDSAYRLTTVTDPLNHATTFGYDLMSNLTSQTDALGNFTNFEYDSFNRLKKVIYPEASSGVTRLEESLTYDQVGNVKTRVDTAGRTTAYNYDTSDRLIKITDAMNKITQFEYNTRSQVTKVKDALNQEYIFTYDPLGRVLSQTRAGTTMSFEYDAVGNRTKRTDYIGRETAYEYDVLNRLAKIEYLQVSSGGTGQAPMQSATYAYDELSRLVAAVNETGTVAFTYDNRNRVKTETDVFGRVVEFGYDANGNRTELKLDGNVHATYAYDAANRLTTLTDDASQSFTYGYDIANKLISKALPNGITTDYEYDGMSRLKRLKDTGPGGVLFDRQYSYNTANQISQIGELWGTKVFGYDNVDRLTSATDAVNGNESYAFDGIGNRTSSHLSNTYTYQPFNKLTETETGTYSHDANGNTISKVEGSKRWTYFWDYENRLTQAWDRKNRVRYRYDALGRRVARYAGANGSTKFTYDGEDVLLDDDASGTVTKYLNGPGIDNKLRSKAGSDVKYFLTDHLGSTNGLADATGSLTATTGYDAFGNQTGTIATRYGFTGRERDDLTGLMYYRNRWYDARLGRFISEDPIGFGGGDINLYGYVKNRPTMLRDPSGNVPVVPIIIGGIVVGGLILASPSPVNAPGPNDPVYYPDNPLLLNAAGGQALGMACGYVINRFASPLIMRLLAGTGDDVITIGISQGPPRLITPPVRGYAPSSPLPQQNVGGVDIPTPLPGAQGPHTTLGTRIGSDGIPYRQTATFPGNTWPTANGQQVPWGRTDWTTHGRPNVHSNPHTRTYIYDWQQRQWRLGPNVPFPGR